MKGDLKIALVGNPNTGKSTLFNSLTGLNQKVGNFPGVTVDKKIGYCKLFDGRKAQIIDLPGTYSLYPKSKDECIVMETLVDERNTAHPDLIIFIADATNLKRNLLLYTQVADLKIPIVLALNMMDLAIQSGIEIAIDALSSKLGVQVVPISARNDNGIDRLKQVIGYTGNIPTQEDIIAVEELMRGLVEQVRQVIPVRTPYAALQLTHQYEQLSFLSTVAKNRIQKIKETCSFHSQQVQAAEIIARYNFINDILFDTLRLKESARRETWSNRIDQVLTHKVFGFFIFLGILFLIFQSIFAWSAYPMDLIKELFDHLRDFGHRLLPAGVLTNLLVDGVLAGLSGVLVFIPQIAILFGFISILEDTGYMSRVTFMMDKLMRKVGLNGKSVVPLVSGFACAVPSIMSTRNIENWKDRMITILVTPLVSCSARLPVYTLLISLAVPSKRIGGMINMQGLALMAMYVLSIASAVVVAWLFKQVLRSRERGYFIMELPVYRMPRWNTIFLNVYQKVKTFVLEAGQVIIAVSIILWVLASYGPSDHQQRAEEVYQSAVYTKQYTAQQIEHLKASARLENSYAGILGRAMEPIIKPLGFDWKIGIALITSFAAREVFVGTMAVIYNVGTDESNSISIQEKMQSAKDISTGSPIFTPAVTWSLMIFYAFAMQCMSTLAIVYRETKSLKWPVIQFGYMTGMAYLASLVVYQLFK